MVTDLDRVTVQWSLIAEFAQSCHEKGAHGYGSLLCYGDGGVTFHHNLFAHHDSRNPRPGDELTVDFVNNVIYNRGSEARRGARVSPDQLRRHHAVAGPARASRDVPLHSVAPDSDFPVRQLLADGNRNGVRDGADAGWAMFRASFTCQAAPFEAPALWADDQDGLRAQLAGAGASRVRCGGSPPVTEVAGEIGSLVNSQHESAWPRESGPRRRTRTAMACLTTGAQHGLNSNEPTDRNRTPGGFTT
jgi:hypothetical protein